jgi:signal transduction histidine kinase
MRTAVISIVAILLFTASLGMQSYERTRRLVESRKGLERQHDEISVANSELEKAREAADSASRAKTAFLANMNHELHTPLHAIIGYSDLVLEEVHSYDNQAVESDLGRIKKSAENLLSIVDSVLDFTRIETGKIELQIETVDASLLCSQLEERIQESLAVNGNRLLVEIADDARWVRADRARLDQVLFGLLSNAANFTQQGSIRLDVTREKTDVSFLVSDSGEGIPEDKLDEIFRPFSQADEWTTRRVGGAGLGLAMCRELCSLMGGGISVTSEVGMGSEFGFQLPVAEEPPESDEREASRSEEQPESSAGPSENPAPSAAGAAIPASRKHDLLTPVNHIIGYGELLAEDAEDAGQEDLLAGLKKVCAGGRALEKIITFHFEAAKKAGGGVDAAKFHAEMDSVLAEVETLSDELLRKVDGDAEVAEDLNKIRTAIVNLTRLAHE